jgi:riboflavin-specific deaminase-like protein
MNVWSHKNLTCFLLLLHLSSMGLASKTNNGVIEDILHQLSNIHQLIASDRLESQLPIVTVSFAQSLDGKMAPYKDPSESETVGNYPLSGKESLRLTHAIRSMHDGILIGGKTLALDNPRLNNRLWNLHLNIKQPIPIVFDTNLDHLSKIKNSLRAENFIVCCSERAANSLESLPTPVLLCPCPCAPDGRIDLRQALTQLYHRHGIKTLMVEGGAQIISSLFQEDLVNAICVTIAPKLLSHGIAPEYGDRALDLTASSSSYLLGKDIVLLSKVNT